MKKTTSIIFILFFFTAMNIVFSQEIDNFPPGGERLHQFRKLKLIESLDLKEEQALRFFSKLNEHEKKVQSIQKHKNEILDTLEILINADGSEKSFERLFDELFEGESQILSERKAFRNEARTLLSPQQVAKWYVFERNFMREVRGTMEDRFQEKERPMHDRPRRRK
mgnify:CR=1 FL=1